MLLMLFSLFSCLVSCDWHFTFSLSYLYLISLYFCQTINAEIIDRHMLLTVSPCTKKSDYGKAIRISTITIMSSRDLEVKLFVTFPPNTCQ